MVLFLLRRDEALKVGLVSTPVAPLLVLLPKWNFSTGAVGAVYFLAYLSFICTLRQRVSRFEIALPIGGKQLFLAKALSMLAAIWLPAGACMVLLLFRPGSGSLFPVLTDSATVVTLAALLPLSMHLEDAVTSIRASILRWLMVVAIGGATWFLLPHTVHLPAFAALTVVVFWRAWQAAPEAIQIAPVKAAHSRQHVAGIPARRPAWWLMWRSAFPWLWVFLFPLGVLAGIASMLAWAFFAFLVILASVSRQGTRWLHPLPVSRRALLTLTLSATVLPFMLGAAAGMAIVPALPSFFFGEMMGFGPKLYRGMHSDFPNTNVPLELWRHAPGRKVPAVQAPWGEAVQPPPLSILGLTFYNPYASGKANSQRFFEWQFGRATEALHGRRYSVAEYLEESFETALPHVTDQPGYDILALAAFLCGSLFATFLNEVALSHSLRRATSVSRYRLLTIAAPFGIPLLVDVYYLFTHSTSVSMPVVRMLLLRVSALLPQNLPAVAAIAIVPALAMYCLLEWQFAQSEITGPMSPALAHLSAGGHR